MKLFVQKITELLKAKSQFTCNIAERSHHDRDNVFSWKNKQISEEAS